MSKNRDLFTEAIADAKAVKAMAIANAKKALEESFTPHLTNMLTTKLEEMEKEELDETVEVDENVNETEEVNETETEKVEESNEETEVAENDELNLDELLAELDEEDEVNESETEVNENVDLVNEKKKDEKEESEEEEIDLEDMSEKDLKSFIEDVIKGMVSDGELEGGHGGKGENEEAEAEEEVSIDEILDSLEEKDSSIHKKEMDKVSEELNEALNTIQSLRKEMNSMNLLNSKLLYVNKIFKASNLNESVKVKVLNSFDKAKSVAETKLVYNTLLESLNKKETVKKSNITEGLGSASKVIKTTKINENKNPIIDNTQATFNRWQKLAGLDKK